MWSKSIALVRIKGEKNETLASVKDLAVKHFFTPLKRQGWLIILYQISKGAVRSIYLVVSIFY